ncbi:uncharacterized protein LOC130510869 [Raphanus sativus]|uniref:Uncharacterized protein LOC130505870 n=1 Tax=Raphanus sativus TaxID=3726 RepID=A0A9W3CY89_RAPSA|nr:uncharacterized protein LOC130505870 [Raphanus sativus]XP_056863545.1 uncharacterized protein LOC130510869 [Raphanus sativus]
MSAAARAYTVEGFNKKFLDIQRASPGCAGYLVDIGFTHWTRAHFQGERFNIMDSNIAESWNSVLKEAREYPLISMCEYIRTTIMSWFALRRAKAMEHKGALTPMVQRQVEVNFEASTALAVCGISETEFQVKAQTGECFLVNLLAGTCSCNAYEQLRIPCRHAVAAAGRANIPTESLVAAAYFADTWHSAYEAKIYPIPSVGGKEVGGEYHGDLLPPAVKRPPGRPRKVRILSRGEDKVLISIFKPHYTFSHNHIV